MTPDISSHAEYRREDYFFQREQSRTMRQMQWEHRGRVFKSWSPHMMAAVGIVLLGLLAIPAAEIVTLLVIAP